MTQILSDDSRLERIEQKADQILDRLTRMEERQNNHGAKLDSHDAQLRDHANRIREVELRSAVIDATSTQRGQRLLGRWAAIGAIMLVLVGVVGTFVGNAIIKLIGGSS